MLSDLLTSSSRDNEWNRFKYTSGPLGKEVKEQTIIDSAIYYQVFNIKLILKRALKSTEHKLSIHSE